jgi:cyclodextrin ABC transporter membrane protein
VKVKKTTIAAIFLILPGVAVFLFFNIYPILNSIYLAFTDAQLGSYPLEETKQVAITGLENFRWILDDSTFRDAFCGPGFLLLSVLLSRFCLDCS